MDRPHVAIVGGGGTGAALAHDLALRGLRVMLLERGELTSGTTGRHHGLLHSGARYAVADAESAVECIQENRILRRIAPGSFEENGGLFVDIVLPQRALSVVGTSAWVVTDPDDLDVPEEHVQAMYREGARLVPAVATADFRAAWSAARPLVGAAGGASGRQLSRTFKCFDHALTDGVEGLVTITGGKATTLRAMAEATADLVCAKLAVEAPCRTREVVLAPHTAYYTGRAV